MSNPQQYTDIDLSNPQQLAHCLESLGGEEKIKTSYPAVYEQIQETRKRHASGRLDTSLLPNMAQGKTIADLQNVVYFASVGYENGKLNILTVISLTCQTPSFIGRIVIQNKDGLIKGTRNITFEKKLHHQDDWEISLPLTEKYTVKLLECSFSTPDGKFVALPEISYEYSINNAFNARSSVDIPKKLNDTPLQEFKNTREQESKIRAFYSRFPQWVDEKDVDYIFEKACDETKGIVNMTLPLKGQIELKEEHGFENYPVDECFAIADFGKGAVGYMNSEKIKIAGGKEFLNWNFPENWNLTLPKSLFNPKILVDLTLQLRANLKGIPAPVSYYASSLLEQDRGFSCRRTRQVYVQLGCVLEGSKILMADGSARPIETIRIGDRIHAVPGNHDSAFVANCWTGRERDLVCIETMDGNILNMSTDHLILTDQGMIPAGRLNAAMTIGMKDGSFCPIRYLYSREGEFTVYNLTLELAQGDKKRMICENMVIADNDNEGETPAKHTCTLLADNEFIKEFSALVKELSK